MFNFLVFWQKADENLKAAQLCYQNSFYNASANRAYYAMYHATIAVLISKGFPPTQKNIDHGWVQSSFAGELINRRKIFPNKFKSYLSETQTCRNIADYDDVLISQAKTFRQIKKSIEFINTIKMEIENA